MKHLKKIDEDFYGPKMKRFFGTDNTPLVDRVRYYLNKWDDIPLRELLPEFTGEFYGSMTSKDAYEYCMNVFSHHDTKELDAKLSAKTGVKYEFITEAKMGNPHNKINGNKK